MLIQLTEQVTIDPNRIESITTKTRENPNYLPDLPGIQRNAKQQDQTEPNIVTTVVKMYSGDTFELKESIARVLDVIREGFKRGS